MPSEFWAKQSFNLVDKQADLHTRGWFGRPSDTRLRIWEDDEGGGGESGKGRKREIDMAKYTACVHVIFKE